MTKYHQFKFFERLTARYARMKKASDYSLELYTLHIDAMSLKVHARHALHTAKGN